LTNSKYFLDIFDQRLILLKAEQSELILHKRFV
jgi:hypothetical protein